MEWTKLTDRTPAMKRKTYLTLDGFGHVCAAHYQDDGSWTDDYGDKTISVTHWMPLPDPPK